MKKILSMAAVLVLGCIVSLNCAAETVYKWTDRSGAVHFGDRPLPDADSEEMRIEPPRPAADDDQAGDSDSAAGDTAAEPGDVPKGNDQAEVEKQRKKIREQNCQIARQTLEHNEAIGRMYRADASGERVYLSDAEREEVLKRSREDIQNWCD